MTSPRRKVRDAMRALEDAVVELHALEERACGRPTARQATSIERARAAVSAAREQAAALDLRGEDRVRVVALVETVGMLLALRERAGDASIAARVLN